MNSRLRSTVMAAVILSVSLLVGLTHAEAAILCVTPGASAKCFASIQPAVDAASDGDEIRVKAGTYTGQVATAKSVILFDPRVLLMDIKKQNTAPLIIARFF